MFHSRVTAVFLGFVFLAPLSLTASRDYHDALDCTGLVPDLKKVVISYLDSWEIKTVGRPLSWFLQVLFSPDQRYLVTLAKQVCIMFNAQTHEIVSTVKLQKNMGAACFIPDTQLLAIGLEDSIVFFDLDLKKLSPVTIANREYMTALACSPNGKFLSCGSIGNGVSLRSTDDLSRRKQWHIAHDNYIFLLAFSPDSSYLASCAIENKIIKVTDLLTGALASTIQNRRRITSLGYVAASNFLATADSSKQVQVWDATTSLPAYTLASDYTVNKIACSPNGKYIAGATEHCYIVIWDCTSRKIITSCAHEPDDYQLSLAFSPDGQSIAIGLPNKPVVILSNQALLF